MKMNIDSPESPGNGIDTSLHAVSAKANAGRAEVSREWQVLLADIETLVDGASRLSATELERAKARLLERATAARASALALGDSIASRARAGARAADARVHEQPWQAIGVGAALGLLVGFALARR